MKHIDFKINPNIINNRDSEKAHPPLLAAKNTYPNFAPLQQDTIVIKKKKNTQKVKKSNFKGIDLTVIEKFKVNISGFESVEDLQKWAEKEINENYINKDFGGRQPETQIQRAALMKEWVDYVTKENDAYTPAIQLLILNAVTKELKQNNDELPPVLNKGVLADVITEIEDRLNTNPKDMIDVNKLYKTALKEIYLSKKSGIKSNFTGWIEIPSKKHDRTHFKANVDKLKALSHPHWCTKSYNAEPYLKEGDFHVYLEKGQPKLGVRFVGSKIQEIQGEKNNSVIPDDYFDIAMEHINKGKYKLSSDADYEVSYSKQSREDFKNAKEKIKEGLSRLKNNGSETIWNYFGVATVKDKDGKLFISEVPKYENKYTLEELGVDMQRLLENVKEIGGDVKLERTNIKSLPNLEKIHGDADFTNANIKDLKNLKYVKGSADFTGTNVRNLDNLEYIGEHLYVYGKDLKNLDNLSHVGGDLSLNDTGIVSLPKLKEVERLSLYNINNNLNLNTIQKVEGVHIDGKNQISKNKNKSTVEMNGVKEMKWLSVFNLDNDKSVHLDSLKYVSGNVNVTDAHLKVPKLEKIGESLFLFDNTEYFSAPKLKSIGRDLYIEDNPNIDKDSFKHIKVKGNRIDNKHLFDKIRLYIFGYNG